MSIEDDIARFEALLIDWGICYADWAGGHRVYPQDRDIVGGGLYPDGGDWVVYDERCRSGFIGVHHDNWSDIHPVKLKSGQKFGANLRLKKIPRRVSTEELMRRYLWISSVFIHWLHVDGASPFDHWDSPEAIANDYQTDSGDFADDPNLALYWLLHFGLCHDPRYVEVAAAVREYGHDKSMEKIRLALVFFDHTGLEHNIDMTPSYNPQQENFRHLFLRRRANLLYLTYSQSYRGAGAAEPIWQSVSLYRAGDPFAIRRMRWLKNNLQQFELWQTLADRLYDSDNNDIPYINYPRVFQPDRVDTDQLADALIQEIMATRLSWRSHSPAWIKEVLWDIREHGCDQTIFKTAVMQVFEGDWAHKRFADILSALGEGELDNPQSHRALADFNTIFTGIDRLILHPQPRIDQLLAASDALLNNLTPQAINYLVGATDSHDLSKVLLRYVLTHPAPAQEGHIVRLFLRTAISNHELVNYFGEAPANLISGSQDPVFVALLRVLKLPDAAFANDGQQSSSTDSACALLLPVAHYPGIFEALTELIDADHDGERLNRILQNLFLWKYSGRNNPMAVLSKAQVELLLDRCIGYICQRPDNFFWAKRIIESCMNPFATQWLEKTLADKTLFHSLSALPGRFDSLAEEVKEALQDALEDIAELDSTH